MDTRERTQKLAHDIRTKIYGREVREALATGIEESGNTSQEARDITENLLDGSYDTGLLNTEIEQRMEGLYNSKGQAMDELYADYANRAETLETTYAPRLTSVEQDVAQLANIEVPDADLTNYATLNYVDDLHDSTTAQLAQITTNAKTEFGLIENEDNTDRLITMLNSDKSHITIPSGTYNISNIMYVTEGVDKKVVGVGEVIFLVDLPMDTYLIQSNINIHFENIIFDFNNGNVKSALLFGVNVGEVKANNLIFRNVRDMGADYGTSIIQIPAKGNSVSIDNITFENMTKLGNGVIGDFGGNLTGIYYGDNSSNPASLKGTITNIVGNNLKNIDLTGQTVNEDVCTIYAYNTNTYTDGKLTIDGVQGIDFGKRLVKTDSSNIDIFNVYGESSVDNVTVMVGLNNDSHDNVNLNVKNVRARGLIPFAVASDCENVHVENLTTDTTGDAILISRDNIVVDNLTTTSNRIAYINSTRKLNNIVFGDIVMNESPNGNQGITVAHKQGVDHLTIRSLTVRSSNPLNSVLNLSASDQINEVVIGKIVLELTNKTSIPLVFRNVSNVTIESIVAVNKSDVEIERLMRFENCKNVNIGSIHADIKTIACVDIRGGSDNFTIDRITAPRSTYTLTVNNSTRIFGRDIDVSKITMSDDTARRNVMPLLPYSTGTDGNRPNTPILGHLFFDKSYKRLLVCTTEAVVVDGIVQTDAEWLNVRSGESV